MEPPTNEPIRQRAAECFVPLGNVVSQAVGEHGLSAACTGRPFETSKDRPDFLRSRKAPLYASVAGLGVAARASRCRPPCLLCTQWHLVRARVMEAGLLVIVFVAGFLTGFSVGERRWKKSAFEAL